MLPPADSPLWALLVVFVVILGPFVCFIISDWWSERRNASTLPMDDYEYRNTVRQRKPRK